MIGQDDKQRWQSLGSASLQSNYPSGRHLGSLPRGMSVEERGRVLQSSLMSPTMNLLSSMPSEKVNARSMEGKRQRRHVLRGAVIVFITAGYSGKK